MEGLIHMVKKLSFVEQGKCGTFELFLEKIMWLVIHMKNNVFSNSMVGGMYHSGFRNWFCSREWQVAAWRKDERPFRTESLIMASPEVSHLARVSGFGSTKAEEVMLSFWDSLDDPQRIVDMRDSSEFAFLECSGLEFSCFCTSPWLTMSYSRVIQTGNPEKKILVMSGSFE